MTTLHHMTSKLARNNGISIAISGDDTFTMTHDFSGKSVTGTDPKALVQALINECVPKAAKVAKPNGADPKPAKIAKVKKAAKPAKKAVKGEPKTKKTLETGRSGVMVLTYHTEYMNNGGGNGDQLDVALREAIMSVAGPKGGKSVVIMENLEKIAKKHGVWNERYESLNPGMARMNVSNRLRALVRNGTAVVIDGKKITKVRSPGGDE